MSAAPLYGSDDPRQLQIIRNQSGDLTSYRQEIAPADLERSRRVASTPRYCSSCKGPWGRELRGGPLVHHALNCAIVPGSVR